MTEGGVNELSRQGGDYPLLTILNDGSTREISMQRLLPLLNRCARELAGDGASLALLICAGAFPDLESPIPVLYPGRIVPAVVAQLSATRRIGIVTPNPGQVASARQHWQRHDFSVEICVASPKEAGALERAAETLRQPDLELIVLDCMGFGPESGRRLAKLVGRPVICPQSLIARVMGEFFGV
jgi:protein AroM